jgi:hypothetical protein
MPFTERHFTEPTEPEQVPTLSPRFRRIAYVIGAVLGLGIAPALIAAGLPEAAGVAAALAGAANVLARANVTA